MCQIYNNHQVYWYMFHIYCFPYVQWSHTCSGASLPKPNVRINEFGDNKSLYCWDFNRFLNMHPDRGVFLVSVAPHAGIVIADLPGGVQKVMNLFRLYPNIVPVDQCEATIVLKVHWLFVYTRIYKFAYRKIYRKNGYSTVIWDNLTTNHRAVHP